MATAAICANAKPVPALGMNQAPIMPAAAKPIPSKIPTF
jgi:hypothetical protein